MKQLISILVEIAVNCIGKWLCFCDIVSIFGTGLDSVQPNYTMQWGVAKW